MWKFFIVQIQQIATKETIYIRNSAFLKGIKHTIQENNGFEDSIDEYTFIEKVMKAGKEEMKKLVYDRMKLFNSVGKV